MNRKNELEDFANKKKIQALRCTIHNKDNMYMYAINSLCQCSFAMTKNKRANIEAFKLSEKAFDAMYHFGHEQFIKNTVESYLAISYIYLLAITETKEINVKYTHHNLDVRFTKHHQLSHAIDKLNGCLMDTNLFYGLYHIEALALSWNIDLHYFVEKILENMEYNNRLGYHE